jgi:hypothetical protein
LAIANFLAEMTSRAELYRNWHEEASNNGSDTAVPCATEHLWCALELQTAVLERISEFHKLAELVLCQPSGSVVNEQRFSTMNHIKTDLRNRMAPPHLNACMCTALYLQKLPI